MNIFVTGINFKTTPLEVREKLSLSSSEQEAILREICSLPQAEECIVLSTCNRTEVYVYTQSSYFDSEMVERRLCEFKGLKSYDFKKYFYFYSSLKAVKHLFKVASGLDSLVLGEDQILGQVKNAHEISLEAGTSSGVLNTLFREAVTAAKNIKTYTDISKNSVSVASLSVKMISNFFGDRLKEKCAMVIGAGKIGAIALKHLIADGTGKVYVTVRSHGKTKDISQLYPNVHAIDYNDRYTVMDECDIIISSTTSPHYTITRDMLEKSVVSKKERVFVDLAVPRDIDLSIKELKGVKYFNMDDLQLSVDQNIDKRLFEVSRADEIIEKYVLEFERWYNFRSVLPTVREIQKYAHDVLNERITSTMSKLKSTSEEDKEVIKASMTSTVNEILNKFIYSVRERGSKEDIETYFRCLGEVIKD